MHALEAIGKAAHWLFFPEPAPIAKSAINASMRLQKASEDLTRKADLFAETIKDMRGSKRKPFRYIGQ